MKLIFALLITMIPWGMFQVNYEQYSKTGHDQFSELIFVDDNHKLLCELDRLYINMRLRALPHRFWGTSTTYLHEYEDATYIGMTVFSRSNKTRDMFVFDYSLTDVVYQERSVSIDGSISLKGVIKGKKVEGTGTVDVSGKISTKDSIQSTEKSSLNVKIYPNKKVTLRVVGEAKVTSGFSKSYIFWICTQKGAWEMVDVVTSYFELVEEDA